MNRARLLAVFARRHTDSYLLLLFLVFALGITAFLMLGEEVREGEIFAFDGWLLRALRDPANPAIPLGPSWLRGAMVDITALGGTAVLTLVTIAVTGYLLVAKRASTALFVVLAVTGGAMAGVLLKQLFSRARPDLVQHFVDVANTSFPSGHATNSAVTYLTLGALLARTQKDRSIRIYLICLAVVLTLTIGSSRVYLGVHWPTDVIAGWCVGSAWAILCSLTARALQRRRALEPEGGADLSADRQEKREV